MLLNYGVREDSWESLGLQEDPTSPPLGRSVLGVHWKDWCWSWNSNTSAIWCEELTHWKRPRCWERLRAGREGDDRGWGGWMASLTRWTWVWVNCGSWWWTRRPGVLWFMGLQRVGHDWVTELNWTEMFGLWWIFYLDPHYFVTFSMLWHEESKLLETLLDKNLLRFYFMFYEMETNVKVCTNESPVKPKLINHHHHQ